MKIVLEMQNVCKTFYGDGVEVKANDHINFNLRQGEIHALLGENGAGKSTLVGTLFRKPDKGIIKLRGQRVLLSNPITALRHGLAIARQDLSKSLIERHTIAENILSVSQGFFLSLNTIASEINRVLEEYDLGELNPHIKIARLSGGEKQRVEILKALITNPDIIILDEPTSMLAPQEIKNLFKLLKTLTAKGKSIVLITHHLEEAVSFSDRITILRQGKVVETLDTNEMKKNLTKNEEESIRHLANLMVGKEVLYDLRVKPQEAGDVVLDVVDLYVNNDMGDLAINGANFQLQENQILGLAGIAGNGQLELVEAIINGRKVESGTIAIRGKNMTNKSIKDIRKMGLAYIPEDRRKALVFDLSIRENLMLNSYQQSKGLYIEKNQIVKQTEALIEQFSIKTPNALVSVRTLSGGNKQKVVIAREFSISPPKEENLILIAENPTFGLDVGTTHFIRNELINMRNSGAAVILVSGDLSEILTLSDIIAVMYKGEITGIIKREDANRESIGLLMGGSSLNLRGN